MAGSRSDCSSGNVYGDRIGASSGRLTCRAGADEKEEFLATMVDQNDRTKKVGDPHNIEGWTG